MMAKKPTSRALGIMAGAAVAASALIALALIILPLQSQRLQASPAQGRTTEPIAQTQDMTEEVYGIDWEYWQGVNRDIAAWITIPGTAIDHPVVRAPADNPQFYLSHDIYGAYNAFGCIYMDAATDLTSPNVYIFGHNMGAWEHSMFSDLANFADADYLQEHATVIIQTPGFSQVLKVGAVELASPYQTIKRMEFEDVEDLSKWYHARWSGATARLPDMGEVDVTQLFTLVTCTDSGNKRVLAYAPALSPGK